MSVIGIFTDTGINKSREAQDNEGFKIFPTSFSVSNLASPSLDPSITTPNAGVFFTGNVSSYVPVSTDTVQINCVISPGQSASLETIREIYVFAKDISNNDFLLALGQPEVSSTILYDPTGETTLRLQFTLVGADLSSLYEFAFTQAEEVTQHNLDPNAHSVIQDAIKKAGIYTQPIQHKYIGQHFDQFATFEGSVVDNDIVYKDTDNLYKKAQALPASIISRAVGIADVTSGCVYVEGLIDTDHGFAHGTNLYLSDIAPGQFTDKDTGVPLGHAVDDSIIAFRVDHKNNVDSIFDAVVSDDPGFRHFETYEDAIAATPDGGWIRIDKLQPLRGASPLSLGGKRLNLVHTGSGTGLELFGGVNEIQRIDFQDPTPDAGKFNLVHDGNKTTDLAFNASALDVQNALEALASINDVSVTGDTTNGFLIEFQGVDGLQDQLQVLGGTDVGVDEIQRLNFNNDDFAGGSFKLELDGEQTAAIAFNSINAATIESSLEALPSLTSVSVALEPSPPAGEVEFTITFDGVDGKQDKSLLVIPAPDNSLVDSGAGSIAITASTDVAGVLPDNTLSLGASAVSVLSSVVVEGELPGSTTAMVLDAVGTQIIGHGRIKDFNLGIDLNGQVDTRIEMIFDNVLQPIDRVGLIENIHYSTHGSIGLTNFEVDDATLFRELVRVDPSLVPDQSVVISPAEITTGEGSTWGLTVDQFVCNYLGGAIDFSTGVVTGAGNDFTPYTPNTAGHYFKYGVALTVNSEIRVILPEEDSAVAASLADPLFENVIARAIVTVKDNGTGGAGTIETILPSGIKRFFTNTATSQVVKSEEFITVGGETTFDAPFEWSSEHTVNDIEVYVNGAKQYQSKDGLLDKDFRKVDSDTIEFSYTFGPSTRVEIVYVGNQIGAGTAGSGLTRKYKEIADGIKTEFTVTDPYFTWVNSDAAHDIDVFLNGVRQDQGAGNDYVKTSNNSIEFTFTPAVNAKICIISRPTAGGSGSGNLISENDGVLLTNDTLKYNFTGSLVTASETSPGEIEVNIDGGGEVNTASNEGTGAEIFLSKVGQNLGFRNIIGAAGITVTLDANNNIVIGLASSVFFHLTEDGFSGISITVPSLYDPTTDKLNVYRNGLRMIVSNSMGIASQRYLESSPTTLTLFENAETDDVFSFVNVLNPPTFTQNITGQTGTVITINNYALGSGRLRVWRNGALMNTAGVGSIASRYTETSTTSITLQQAATASEVFVVEYAALAFNFIEYVTNVAGTTVNLVSNTYTLGTDKLLVYRNGVKINNSSDLTLGNLESRYQESTNSSITLEAPGSVLSDVWTFIELS